MLWRPGDNPSVPVCALVHLPFQGEAMPGKQDCSPPSSRRGGYQPPAFFLPSYRVRSPRSPPSSRRGGYQPPAAPVVPTIGRLHAALSSCVTPGQIRTRFSPSTRRDEHRSSAHYAGGRPVAVPTAHRRLAPARRDEHRSSGHSGNGAGSGVAISRPELSLRAASMCRRTPKRVICSNIKAFRECGLPHQ